MADRSVSQQPQGYAPRGGPQYRADPGPPYRGDPGHPGPPYRGDPGHPYRPGDAGQYSSRSEPYRSTDRSDKYSLDSYSQRSYPQGYYGQPPLSHASDVERGAPLPMTIDDKDFNDHMRMAVFSAVCCCWPVGIVGVMKAMDARKSYQHGDTGRAYSAAYQARKFSIWSMSIGVITFILVIMAVIIILSYRL